MSTLINSVTDDSFESEVLEANGYVLVDFWAPWCGPCRMLAPTLEATAESYQGKVKFLKLNIEENRTTTIKYEVKSIPTLILYKDGKMIETKIGGGLSKSQLAAFLDSNI